MKERKKYSMIVLLAALFTLSIPLTGICADDPEARVIMEKVDAQEDGDNQTSKMEMILIDKNNKERVRKIRTFRKDKSEDSLSLMFFEHPADVKNTAFLTYDYDTPDKDDDQWLYLPALKKTKRIASSDKSGSFMGSDLNYSDMTSRNLSDFDHSFYEKGKEKAIKGVKTWVIWSIPRSKKVIKETGYVKSLLFVRQDNYVVIRSLSWVNNGVYRKYMKVEKLEKIDNIWVPTEIHVTKKKGKKMVHKTILHFRDVKFNQELNYDIFTVRRMEKGL